MSLERQDRLGLNKDWTDVRQQSRDEAASRRASLGARGEPTSGACGHLRRVDTNAVCSHLPPPPTAQA